MPGPKIFQPVQVPIFPHPGGSGSVFPPPTGGGSSTVGRCGQLQQDISNLESQIAQWQNKLNGTAGPDGPGTPRGNIQQTIQMLQDELATSQQALVNAGCLGGPIPPACKHDFNTPSGTISIVGIICKKWTALGADKTADSQNVQVFLGNPVGTTQYIFQTTRELIVQYFEQGVIVDVQGTNDPHVVYGSIFVHYQDLGGIDSFLGVPVSDEEPAPNGGRVSHFESGDIYWRGDTGVHEVHGAIRDKFNSLGGVGAFLGYPLTDETPVSDGIGRFNHFQGGSIYWTSSTGAHEVHGAIRDKWNGLGGPAGILDYPTTDETGTPDGIGRFNHFQGGSIYWTPATGAHEVHGTIGNKWATLGWEQSYLRYPITDVMPQPDGKGSVSNFQRGHIVTNDVNAFDVADARIFDTGPMSASFVTGSAQLAITSNGFWSFRGHVHDAGFVGHNYALGMAIDFRDASGTVKAVAQEGSLHGTIAIGDRTDNWQQDGSDAPDPFIVNNWDALQNVGAKSRLHVSTSAIDVVTTVLAPLTLLVLAVAAVLFVTSPKAKSHWTDPSDPNDPNRVPPTWPNPPPADPTDPLGTPRDYNPPLVRVEDP